MLIGLARVDLHQVDDPIIQRRQECGGTRHPPRQLTVDAHLKALVPNHDRTRRRQCLTKSIGKGLIWATGVGGQKFVVGYFAAGIRDDVERELERDLIELL